MSNIRHFYKCGVCGNVAELVESSGVRLECCGKYMEEIKPNTVDASQEKARPRHCAQRQ